MTFTLGTHNLEDDSGEPTFFADAILFTEAIAPTIRAKAKQRLAFGRARLRGYRIVVCHEQRDLVFAVRRRLFHVESTQYTKYVDGVAHVTPHRGTFVVFATNRATGKVEAFVLEHRINAAFPPYIRGEGAFRQRKWLLHTGGTVATVRRLSGSGYPVHAGGDPNTPHESAEQPYVAAYRGHLHELGTGLQRLGSTTRLTGLEYQSRKGSDHFRMSATVQEDA